MLDFFYSASDPQMNVFPASYPLKKNSLIIIYLLPKVKCSINENASHGNAKASVKSLDAIGFEDLNAAIYKSIELSLISCFSNINSKPGSGKVQWVDKQQANTSCYSTTHKGPEEIPSNI